jgi:hypothetical protein
MRPSVAGAGCTVFVMNFGSFAWTRLVHRETNV